MDTSLNDDEKRFILAEMIRASETDVASLASCLRAVIQHPNWLAMSLPNGRNMNQCLRAAEEMFESPMPAPQLKRKSAGANASDQREQHPAKRSAAAATNVPSVLSPTVSHGPMQPRSQATHNGYMPSPPTASQPLPHPLLPSHSLSHPAPHPHSHPHLHSHPSSHSRQHSHQPPPILTSTRLSQAHPALQQQLQAAQQAQHLLQTSPQQSQPQYQQQPQQQPQQQQPQQHPTPQQNSQAGKKRGRPSRVGRQQNQPLRPILPQNSTLASPTQRHLPSNGSGGSPIGSPIGPSGALASPYSVFSSNPRDDTSSRRRGTLAGLSDRAAFAGEGPTFSLASHQHGPSPSEQGHDDGPAPPRHAKQSSIGASGSLSAGYENRTATPISGNSRAPDSDAMPTPIEPAPTDLWYRRAPCPLTPRGEAGLGIQDDHIPTTLPPLVNREPTAGSLATLGGPLREREPLIHST